MKSLKGFKAAGYTADSDDTIRKPAKLDPVRKSGKERHSLYTGFGSEDDDPEEEFEYRKRESVLDYFDDDPEEDEL